MFSGVAFGGFEVAVHEFGPCYRAGKFVIGQFGAHQLTDASRLIMAGLASKSAERPRPAEIGEPRSTAETNGKKLSYSF